MASSDAEKFYDSTKGRLDLMAYPKLLVVAEEHPSSIIRASAASHLARAKDRWDKRQHSKSPEAATPQGECALCGMNPAVAWCSHTDRGARVAVCIVCLDAIHSVAKKPLGEGSYSPNGGATNPYAPNLGVDDGSS